MFSHHFGQADDGYLHPVLFQTFFEYQPAVGAGSDQGIHFELFQLALLARKDLESQLIGTFLIGFPFKRKMNSKDVSTISKSQKVTMMPYGVAIGIGSLLTLAVSWWTGQENWFLSFVKIAANP